MDPYEFAPVNLNKTISIRELFAAVSIWKARLFVLRNWIMGHGWHPKIEKACSLAAELAVRISYLMQKYNEAMHLIQGNTIGKYKPGGIVHESGPEMIDWRTGIKDQQAANLEEIKRLLS